MTTSNEDDVISQQDYQALQVHFPVSTSSPVIKQCTVQQLVLSGKFVVIQPHLLPVAQQVALAKLLMEINSVCDPGVVIMGGPINPPFDN